MRVGETLDAAIKLYRQHWKTLMGIAAFVIIPLAFVQQATTWAVIRPFEPVDPFESVDASGLALTLAFSALQFLIIQPFLAGAYARAVSEAYLGRAPDIGSTYRAALPLIPAILWVTILQGLAVLGGVILLVIPAFLFFVRFAFGPAVVVVEGSRGTDAMRRSWRLAKDHFWRLFGTIVLAGIIASIVSGILYLPLGAVATGMGSSGWIVAALGYSLAEVITAPFSIAVTVLLYFDLRIRKEGFDLAVMAEEIARRGDA